MHLDQLQNMVLDLQELQSKEKALLQSKVIFEEESKLMELKIGLMQFLWVPLFTTQVTLSTQR